MPHRLYVPSVCPCHPKLAHKEIGKWVAHMADVYGITRPYVCYVGDCRKDYEKSCRLKEHKASIHKIGKLYICDVGTCRESFTSQLRLGTHKIGAHIELRFLCPTCNNRFAREISLENHMLTHTNKERYPCEYPGCPKTYLSRWTANDHDKRCHANTEHVGPSQPFASNTPLADDTPIAATSITANTFETAYTHTSGLDNDRVFAMAPYFPVSSTLNDAIFDANKFRIATRRIFKRPALPATKHTEQSLRFL